AISSRTENSVGRFSVRQLFRNTLGPNSHPAVVLSLKRRSISDDGHSIDEAVRPRYGHRAVVRIAFPKRAVSFAIGHRLVPLHLVVIGKQDHSVIEPMPSTEYRIATLSLLTVLRHDFRFAVGKHPALDT